MVQEARPDRAEAAARTRWSSPTACRRARSAWAIVPAGSPALRARAARYISMRAGIRAHSSRSRTTSRSSSERQLSLDVHQPFLDPVERVAGHQAPIRPRASTGRLRSTASGRSSTQPRMTTSCRSRASPGTASLDQVGRPVHVPGGQGVPHGRDGLSGGVVPGAGPAVQPGDTVRVLDEQVGAQDVGEEVVVAVPLPTVVQGHHEQVAALQQLEHACALPVVSVTASHSGPVSCSRTAVSRRNLADVGGLAVEHLLDEVVDDVPVVPGEAGDEQRRVVTAAQRERGQLERGDPALGAGPERGDVGRVQVEPGGRREVGGRLLLGEPEVGRTHLGQLSAGTQPGQGQRRVGAGADDQAHLRRQPLQQQRHAGLHVGPLGEVVVVEHEGQGTGQDAQLVEDGGQHGLDRLPGLEQRQPGAAGVGCGALECRQHVAPEDLRARVGRVQGHPGGAGRRTRSGGLPRQPRGEQRRLPEAGGRGHEGQPGPARDLLQTRAGHQLGTGLRQEELGLDEGHGHGSIILPLTTCGDDHSPHRCLASRLRGLAESPSPRKADHHEQTHPSCRHGERAAPLAHRDRLGARPRHRPRSSPPRSAAPTSTTSPPTAARASAPRSCSPRTSPTPPWAPRWSSSPPTRARPSRRSGPTSRGAGRRLRRSATSRPSTDPFATGTVSPRRADRLRPAHPRRPRAGDGQAGVQRDLRRRVGHGRARHPRRARR